MDSELIKSQKDAFIEVPKLRVISTGTTIVGVVYREGIVLGADTRATNGPIVADKNCSKIHYLAPNIYCCGAGTAADTESITSSIRSTLELHRMEADRNVRVVTAMTLLKQRLFKYQGNIGAALIVGGVDCSGPRLYTVYPHGSTDHLPFVAMGSGSLAAMSMLETHYSQNMDRKDAIELVVRAIRSGILNDLGSGSNVDLVVIPKIDQVEILRNVVQVAETPQKTNGHIYPKQSTIVINERVKLF
jgi:20S proteasome subunit beta 2